MAYWSPPRARLTDSDENAITAAHVRRVLMCSQRSTCLRQVAGGALALHSRTASLIGTVPASVAAIQVARAAIAAPSNAVPPLAPSRTVTARADSRVSTYIAGTRMRSL